MELIPEPPISCSSPPTSPALAFHYLRFPSSPPRSGQNPFSSPPSPVVLPPLLHQPFTISALLSSPPRFGWNPFSSPPSPVVLLPPVSTTSPAPAFHHLRFPSSPPRSDGTHFRGPHLLLFSSLLSCTSLSPSSLAVVDAAGTGDWEQEISTEPIALFSSLLSRTILSRFLLAVVDATGTGDREWEWEISTKPIALFSSFLSRTNLSASWPCHHGCRWGEDRERKIRTEGRRAW